MIRMGHAKSLGQGVAGMGALALPKENSRVPATSCYSVEPSIGTMRPLSGAVRAAWTPGPSERLGWPGSRNMAPGPPCPSTGLAVARAGAELVFQAFSG